MKKRLIPTLCAYALVFVGLVCVDMVYVPLFSASKHHGTFRQTLTKAIMPDPHLNAIPEDIKTGEFDEPHDQQSPIAINMADTTKVVDVNLRDIEFHYKSKRFEVKKGHAIDVFPLPVKNFLTGTEKLLIDYIILDGMSYRLAQFHFHMPSEHSIDGKRYPLEVHFVHTSEKLDEKGVVRVDENGKPLFDYAVIGVLIIPGVPHAEFEKIIARMPAEKTEGAGNIIDQDIDLMKLLPQDHRVLRYYGSLTTKPFTTGVKWQLMKQPIEFSQDQIDRIKKVMHMHENAREEQVLRVPIVNDIVPDVEKSYQYQDQD